MTLWLWAPASWARHVRTSSHAAACASQSSTGTSSEVAQPPPAWATSWSWTIPTRSLRLTRYSQQLWQELRPELPDDVEYEQCGTIWVAADDEEMLEVRRKREYYGKRGVPTEVLDTASFAESGTQPAPGNGWRSARSGRRRAVSAVCRPLSDGTRSGAGSQASTRCSVSRRSDKGAGAVDRRHGNFRGNHRECELALTPPTLTPGLEIKKRKGHLVITDRYPGFVRHQLVELGYLKSAHSVSGDSVAFNVQPRRTGQILIGSSRQYGAEHKEVDNSMLVRMLQRAQEYMPGLAQMSTVRTWTGFRAATPDKLPLIGPWTRDKTGDAAGGTTGDKSIFLATGHEGLGITTSLGTARILVDQITGTKPEIPVEPYLPSRIGEGVRTCLTRSR